VQGQIDEQTEAAFADLFNAGRLQFYLECAECRFEIPTSITVNTVRPLTRDGGQPLAKSLFEYVEHEEQNEYERAIALCLDSNADVLWWYRNLVGPEHFAVQGYKRHRIRPDFVVQSGTKERPEHRVIVIESKGAHLQGNLDTEYKRKVAGYFEKVGKKVTWQQLGEDFKDHVFRFQILDEAQELGRDWKDELRELLASVD
jgi:type III restriction enzyme